MGDNLHFLEQLEKRRADSAHTQSSMVLYNSSDLTKHILDRANAPDGRVAISLDEGDTGAHLVVERSGRTVTYLEKGMKVKDANILPYAKLAAIAAHIDDWRDRCVEAERLLGPRGDVTVLLRRLVEAGRDLTREEFRAISAWQPLFRSEMLTLLGKLAGVVEHERYELRKLSRVRTEDTPQLRRHWNLTWAIGHLTLLVAMDGREFMEALPAELAWARGLRLSLCTFAQGLIPLALRGAWAVSEVGRPTLQDYREAFRNAKSPTLLLNAGLGLLALGARHERLRGLVRKTLARTLQFPSTPQGGGMQQIQELLKEVAGLVFDEPESWLSDMRQVLGGLFIESVAPKLKPGSPFRFTEPSEVPRDLAVGMLGWVPATFLQPVSFTNLLCRSVPLVTAETAETLYFPQAVHDDLVAPWTPEQTLRLIQLRQLPEPVRVAAPPGRNEPCSCGSGLKYKHCHGR